MRELFIVEKETHGFSVHRAAALLVAVVFLLVFTGCSPTKAVNVDKARPWAQITLTIDKSSKYAPTFAVWVEDAETAEASTLIATQKAAKNEFSGGQRPGALPVWTEAKSRAGTEAADTISSATPSGSSAKLLVQIPDKYRGKKINIYIEANVSYDYNDYYKQGLKIGDAGYNDVNGQPSVIWKATVDTAANPSGSVQPEITGHSDAMGATGNVDADMKNITTAAKIFSNIQIEYNMGK